MKSLFATLWMATLPAFSADPAWPQFRGPSGSGVAESQHPVTEFGPTKNLLWKVTVPSGASSPVISGDRIFLTGYEDKTLWTFCLGRGDGRELWRAKAPATIIEKFHEVEGSAAASSAATDGERVVVYFGSFGLLCYDPDGKELWRTELPLAETDNDFGSGTSPILDRGRVFLVRDLAKNSAVFCFDAQTGRQLWKTSREGFFTSYSSPVLWRHEGREDLVVGGSLRVKAYDPATGAERWMLRNVPPVNCTSPVVANGLLYFGGWTPAGVVAPVPEFADFLKHDVNSDGALSKAEAALTTIADFFATADANHDGSLRQKEWDSAKGFLGKGQDGVLCIKPGGAGDITDSHVAWRAERGLPYVSTPLVYRDHLYLLKDGGLASCFDGKTGKALYTQKRLGIEGAIYSSAIAADGRIYGISLRGVAFVYAAGEKPTGLHQIDLGERACATPAVAGDVLYFRTATKMWAFGKK